MTQSEQDDRICRKRPGWCLAVGIASLVLLSAGARAADTMPPERCPGAEIDDRVEAFVDAGASDPEAALRLGSGEIVRLRDVRLAEGEAGGRARAWLRQLVGRRVRGRAAPADRWERRPSSLTLEDVVPIDVAGLLVAEGYAVVDPGEADRLCDPALLDIEAKARERRLGTWRTEDGVVKAEDAATLDRLVGRFVVAEGRIVSVGERPQRSYLNFGRAGSGALTATLPRRSWTELKRRGLTADTLRGRRVRVRGWLDRWRSPTVEIVAGDMLELLDGASHARPR